MYQNYQLNKRSKMSKRLDSFQRVPSSSQSTSRSTSRSRTRSRSRSSSQSRSRSPLSRSRTQSPVYYVGSPTSPPLSPYTSTDYLPILEDPEVEFLAEVAPATTVWGPMQRITEEYFTAVRTCTYHGGNRTRYTFLYLLTSSPHPHLHLISSAPLVNNNA